jgi:hypothetical protein
VKRNIQQTGSILKLPKDFLPTALPPLLSLVASERDNRTSTSHPSVKRLHKRIRALLAVTVFGLSAVMGATPDPFAASVQPFVTEYCRECHGGAKSKGGVNFDPFTNSPSVFRNPRLWESALRQIEDRQMPPKDKRQPDQDLTLKWRESLQSLLKNPDPTWLPHDPGNPVIHRLNRTEYNNTVRDLLGVTNRPADRFPADGGGGGGFDNNAETLFLPPILMERYLAAAEEILDAAPENRLIPIPPKWYRSNRQTAELNLKWFCTRAFRGPVATADFTGILTLFERAYQSGQSFAASIKGAYKAVLVSPRFLFRIEHREAGGGPWRISDYELASRLSYFLWSSMPDDELLAVAERGNLSKRGTLEAQVRRMLRDSRSRDFSKNFVSQWLGTGKLATTSNPDRGKFPQYTDRLRDAMISEPVEFFAALLETDDSVLKLLDSDFTFANEDLARLYGITNVAGPQLVKIQLPDKRRGGITGMAAVLTQTSYPLRTSPVLRGKWILEEILGTPPPPPPPLVKTLPPNDQTKDGLSFRKQLEQHRSDPNCSGCHSRMDPLGFALENFDAIGGWRDRVADQPVDSSGVLVSGETVNGPIELKAALLKKKELFLKHLTEKLLAYALGRGLEYYDTPAVYQIITELGRENYRSTALVLEIVNSFPFQWRRSEPTPAAVTAKN